METVAASIVWPGSTIDVLRLLRAPTPALWGTDPIDDEFAILPTLDENEHETGEITGIEIIGFLGFDRWSDPPEFPSSGNYQARRLAHSLMS